jgi:hypothetical protein
LKPRIRETTHGRGAEGAGFDPRGAQAEMSVSNPVRWSPVFWACCLIISLILSITLAWSAGLIALVFGDTELAHHLGLQTLRRRHVRVVHELLRRGPAGLAARLEVALGRGLDDFDDTMEGAGEAAGEVRSETTSHTPN